jgi:hypothetical protein
MLLNGNIDLMHEKKELEAFLSICLEKADLILGPEAQEPEEKYGIHAPEPAAGEAASRVAGPSSLAEPPAKELQDPVAESEPEARAFETVRIPQPEETDAREKSIYEIYAQRPEVETLPEAQSLPSEQAVKLPKSHFSPDDELSIPPVQLSALEKELASEKQQLDTEGMAQASDAGDKSSLRKPSKNLAALEFARKQAEQQKRMRTMLAVLAAVVFILGIVWFVPFQKIADSLLGPGKGQSVQVDSKAAGAKDAASKNKSRD